jgi:hypothetical protein
MSIPLYPCRGRGIDKSRATAINPVSFVRVLFSEFSKLRVQKTVRRLIWTALAEVAQHGPGFPVELGGIDELVRLFGTI